MHAGLMPNGRVVFLDKVENYTQIKLGNGQFAYSAEYDPVANKVVGLPYKVRICSWMIRLGQTNSVLDECFLLWRFFFG